MFCLEKKVEIQFIQVIASLSLAQDVRENRVVVRERGERIISQAEEYSLWH